MGIKEEHAVETFKSIQAISLAGLKLLALFNGGAAVALLAFLGNIAGKGIPIPEMALPLMLYLVGLFLCGLAFLAGYATQLVLYNESVGRPPRFWKSQWFQLAGVVLASASLILFMVGSSVAAGRFPSGPVPTPCADVSV